jgi:hypothetical protein
VVKGQALLTPQKPDKDNEREGKREISVARKKVIVL